MQIIQSIQNRIYEVRGERVMLDFDLAQLYEVATKVLNQAVKRNIKRFPPDFMFRLDPFEWEQLMRSQIVTASEDTITLRTGSVTVYQTKRNKDVTPYAFTEQGIAMLSGVLNSDKAITMNISIMRAFIDIRKMLTGQSNLKDQLNAIKDQLINHDVQLNHLYDAIENILDSNSAETKWKNRDRIGFKQG